MTETAETVRPVPRWLHVSAIAALAVALFPLVLGQIVTSIRAGMADPLWPTEPWYLVSNYKLDFGYLVEHSHRIAGFCVGGLISLLAIGIWWTEPRKSARWLGILGIVALLIGFGEFHRAVMPKQAQQSNVEVSQAEQQRLTVPPIPVAVMGTALLGVLALGTSALAHGVGGSGLRILGVFVLVAVMIQGLLGGLRVKLDALVGPEMAMIHGIFAQVVFGSLVAIAVLTARLPAAKVPGHLVRWSLMLAAVMFTQVVLGALVRHSPTPLTQRLHFLTAFLATGLAVWLLLALAADTAARSRVSFAWWALGALIALQLVLGVEAWMAKFGTYTHPDLLKTTPWSAAIRTAHTLVGTLVLATTVGLAIRLRQPVSGKISTPESVNTGWYEPSDTAARAPAVAARLGGDSA